MKDDEDPPSNVVDFKNKNPSAPLRLTTQKITHPPRLRESFANICVRGFAIKK